MSTAAAWDALPMRKPVSRPRFVVLEGGDGFPTARDGGAGRTRAQVARPRTLAVPRWVRLAVTLSVVAVLATVLFGIGGAGAATGPLGSVEVRPGQTLSEIARAELPAMSTTEAVARIQLANNLPSSHVTAGQVLIIPSP
jgi:nucleoid-associated protein YgaU